MPLSAPLAFRSAAAVLLVAVPACFVAYYAQGHTAAEVCESVRCARVNVRLSCYDITALCKSNYGEGRGFPHISATACFEPAYAILLVGIVTNALLTAYATLLLHEELRRGASAKLARRLEYARAAGIFACICVSTCGIISKTIHNVVGPNGGTAVCIRVDIRRCTRKPTRPRLLPALFSHSQLHSPAPPCP